VSVPSTETVSTMGVQWRFTPRIDSLDTKKKKHTYLVIRNMFVRFIFIFQLSILKTIISALIRRTITIQSQLVLQFTRLNLETPAQLLAILSFKRNCWNLLTHSWLPSGSASPLMLWSSSCIFYFVIFFIIISQQGRLYWNFLKKIYPFTFSY
jgi:hypothetical protein